MKSALTPHLTEEDFQEGLVQARLSKRHRHTRILHNPGDEFNRAVNFMLEDSYMRPHLHPGVEKIENICLIQGKIVMLFFDDQGIVRSCKVLEDGGEEMIVVPAFTWHTYVILSKFAITYETMMGRYEPTTWKRLAEYSCGEDSSESDAYLRSLKKEVSRRIAEGATRVTEN
ncbi:cupin fold metalloprotein, WbuC family [bacterium]|nr:MAG: cupin fold metalloprotein, WbuC family [bacterium]